MFPPIHFCANSSVAAATNISDFGVDLNNLFPQYNPFPKPNKKVHRQKGQIMLFTNTKIRAGLDSMENLNERE